MERNARALTKIAVVAPFVVWVSRARPGLCKAEALNPKSTVFQISCLWWRALGADALLYYYI